MSNSKCWQCSRISLMRRSKPLSSKPNSTTTAKIWSKISALSSMTCLLDRRRKSMTYTMQISNIRAWIQNLLILIALIGKHHKVSRNITNCKIAYASGSSEPQNKTIAMHFRLRTGICLKKMQISRMTCTSCFNPCLINNRRLR